MKKLREETEDLSSQVAQLVEAEAKRSEGEQALQRAQTQLNHWKQKSVQQDMVLQTNNQVYTYTNAVLSLSTQEWGDRITCSVHRVGKSMKIYYSPYCGNVNT